MWVYLHSKLSLWTQVCCYKAPAVRCLKVCGCWTVLAGPNEGLTCLKRSVRKLDSLDLWPGWQRVHSLVPAVADLTSSGNVRQRLQVQEDLALHMGNDTRPRVGADQLNSSLRIAIIKKHCWHCPRRCPDRLIGSNSRAPSPRYALAARELVRRRSAPRQSTQQSASGP